MRGEGSHGDSGLGFSSSGGLREHVKVCTVLRGLPSAMFIRHLIGWSPNSCEAERKDFMFPVEDLKKQKFEEIK